MDRLAAELGRIGMPTRFQNLGRDGRMGRLLRLKNAEICFGLEDDDETVVVTDYRRTDPKAGLRMGIRELLWFIEFLAARPEFGVKRLHGLIRPDKTSAGLTPERLAALYRIHGGRHERRENGEDWIVVEFSEYRPTRRPQPMTIASEVVTDG
jgi:hypothetical protein